MKKTTYQINIENPCHEQWDKMTETEQGHFCSHCSKTVIDFTQLSDKEIIRILQQQSGNMCGRFFDYQLNKDIIAPSIFRNRHFPIILTGLLLLGVTDFAFAKPPLKPSTEFSIQTNNTRDLEEYFSEEDFPKDNTDNIIEGKITNFSTKGKISDVLVQIKNTSISTSTNKDGYYRLTIPANQLSSQITLVVSCIGYVDQEVVINQKKLPIRKDIVLRIQSFILGKIAVIKNKK